MELYQDQARRPDGGDQHSASGSRNLPIPAAARSEARVCDRSLAGFSGSNPARGIGVYFVSVVCCQVEVSALARSLVQKSSTEYGVSKCDRVASIMRRPWPTRGCCATGKKSTKTLVILGTLHKNYYSLRRSFQ
jgi:hypothetical protein